jgi:hypothetical protein
MSLDSETTVDVDAGADEAPAVVSVQVLPVPLHVVEEVWPAMASQAT